MNAQNNAYTIISLVFFLPYALFQPPATVAIRENGPRRFLATIILLWGAVMIVSLRHRLHSLILFLAGLLLNYLELWIRTQLASPSRSPGHSWLPRSWILPWLCLPPEHMVSTL
jgi:hypothetical protein